MKNRKVKIWPTGEVGTFLEWGIDSITWLDRWEKTVVAPATIALIELPTGRVECVRPDDIEFVQDTWVCGICKQEGHRWGIRHKPGCENENESEEA
jgi:hypothetical protein